MRTLQFPDARRAGQQRGFTMIEVLVSLVVLAIGLLGIAALYLDSLRSGRTAIYRTQAVNLAADLADRIRANRGAILDYDVDFDETPDTVEECATTDGCSAAEMAATDLATWKADLARTLPAGEGSVEVVAPVGAGAPATYVVTIRWNEAGEDAPLEFQLGFST